ncbi:glycosyltransferase [Streptomyces mirabilis]|uniref:glycosyltransferase n=1 Tax=Streptomyces mirabilis TaxID=68239 RepID=UPI00332C3E30
MKILQIPEICSWNTYIELAEQHLAANGNVVLRPGLCRDGAWEPPTHPPTVEPTPDIVHVHWPEMLADWYGFDGAVAVLRDLRRGGAQLVQTVHDLHPHEMRIGAREYFHEVDAMTSGVHFFSEEHERQARAVRPYLPTLSTRFLHPAFADEGGADRSSPPKSEGEVTIGCFGRIRPYKRYAEFGRAFADAAVDGYRLLIAGAPLDDGIHQEMLRLARTCPHITYEPGFHDGPRFSSLIEGVDWVALPYREVYSSGVLVQALQAGKPVLAPKPIGVDAYELWPGLLTVSPWSDNVAVRRWMDEAHDPKWRNSDVILPSWEAAARQLTAFYRDTLNLSHLVSGGGRSAGSHS